MAATEFLTFDANQKRLAQAEGLQVTVVADAHSTGGRPTAPGIIAEHNAMFATAGARLVTTDELTR